MTSVKYTLQDFKNVMSTGFYLTLPDETVQIINDLTAQVGAPSYIKTPTFYKKETPSKTTSGNDYNSSSKRSKLSGGRTVNNEDWESIRTFKTTKMEEKKGVDVQIDLIRFSLNKMSEKNYIDQSSTIFDILDKLMLEDSTSEEDINKVGNIVFEIASNNRFYSSLYADLYAVLIKKYDIMKDVFDNNLNAFLEIFNNIEWVDANEDYDKFCKVNKDNEKRKSLSSFFVNLVKKNIITKERLIEITYTLLKQVVDFLDVDNKKGAIDEMIENIFILYNKDWLQDYKSNKLVGNETFVDIIKRLSASKIKTHVSLTNKTIFKCMDIIEM